jgi:adenylosuccinate lyase
MEKGIARMTAYDIVQAISLKVINGNSTFKKEVLVDKEINKYLSKKEIENIFDPYSYLNNINKIYKRAGL